MKVFHQSSSYWIPKISVVTGSPVETSWSFPTSSHPPHPIPIPRLQLGATTMGAHLLANAMEFPSIVTQLHHMPAPSPGTDTGSVVLNGLFVDQNKARINPRLLSCYPWNCSPREGGFVCRAANHTSLNEQGPHFCCQLSLALT